MESRVLTSMDGIALDAAVHHPTGERVGTIVAAHGITADMDEGGMFVRLGERLADAGFVVVRFSFRGHGDSGGTERGVTIAGEMLDLQIVVDEATSRYPGPLSVVAASFGAVSTALSLPYLVDRLRGVVLWNPVLDLRRTFLEPELPWGLANFGPEGRRHLETVGFLLVDGEFELGRVLFEEFRHYQPDACFSDHDTPALVIHGDHDTYVSYEVAQSAAARANCVFHTVRGSDHGFDSREHEDEAIEVTVDWLTQQHTGAP